MCYSSIVKALSKFVQLLASLVQHASKIIMKKVFDLAPQIWYF